MGLATHYANGTDDRSGKHNDCSDPAIKPVQGVHAQELIY